MGDKQIQKMERCMTEIKSELKHIIANTQEIKDKLNEHNVRLDNLEILKFRLQGGIAVITSGLVIVLVKVFVL